MHNIIFYSINKKRIKLDIHFNEWIKSKSNYISFMSISHCSLLTSLKLFRILYSRFFNLMSLSMIFLKSNSIFPLTNVMTLLNLIFC
jgi:hypothetical protein